MAWYVHCDRLHVVKGGGGVSVHLYVDPIQPHRHTTSITSNHRRGQPNSQRRDGVVAAVQDDEGGALLPARGAAEVEDLVRLNGLRDGGSHLSISIEVLVYRWAYRHLCIHVCMYCIPFTHAPTHLARRGGGRLVADLGGAALEGEEGREHA